MDSFSRQQFWRISSAENVPPPNFYRSANDTATNQSAQDLPLLDNRKRKADDEQFGRRVRSGAPPPSPYVQVMGADASFGSMSSSARHWIRGGGGEGRSPDEGYGRALPWTSSSLQVDVRGILHSEPSIKREKDSFEGEIPRQRPTSSILPGFRASLSPEMHGAPPGRSGNEGSKSSLSPKMFGTPPGYSGNKAAAGMGYANRKRSRDQDVEDDEAQEGSRRTKTNMSNVQELEAGSTKPQSDAMDAPSSMSRLPELNATIQIFSYSGLKLGHLLPCGEILGFAELPPLAQLYDINTISLITPRPMHAWIQQNWRAIHTSIGTRAPTWQHNYWHEETGKSGTVHQALTIRAIKTFRELGEKLWRISIPELREETLSLFQKEMDYTVLLLLVHRHEDDRDMWEHRLKVLFARLDPALRPRTAQFAESTTSTSVPTPASASASIYHTQNPKFSNAPLMQTSSFLTMMEEPVEYAAYFTPWPAPRAPSIRTPSFPQKTAAVNDEFMNQRW